MFRLGDLMCWGPSLAQAHGHGRADVGASIHAEIERGLRSRYGACQRKRLAFDLTVALGWVKVVYLDGDYLESSSTLTK